MAIANVRGVSINYEVLGSKGPWVALSPGGRRAIEGVESLSKRIAAAGYRVLVHDRRNCGASDVAIEGRESENEIWADDLHELLKQRHALPAWIGGSSSGCRMALLFALRHPQATRGLLLWRVTGGLAWRTGTTASTSRSRSKAAWPPSARPRSSASASGTGRRTASG